MACKFWLILIPLIVSGCTNATLQSLVTAISNPQPDIVSAPPVEALVEETQSEYAYVAQPNPVSIASPLPITETRKALVIGNSNYGNDDKFAPLSKPVSDATAVHIKLQDYGFKTTLVTDADADTLIKAITKIII